MATVILDYDSYNVMAQKALDNILSSGFFKVQRIETLRKNNPTEEKDYKFMYSVSEQTLAKDWLNEDEDEAWKNL